MEFRNRSRLLYFGVIITASLLVLHAASYHTSFAQTDFWQQTNGPQGAIVLSFAIDSTNRVLAGTANGIEAREATGGEWSNLGLSGYEILSLLVHPDGLIFAGTSLGVLRSTDNGASWIASGLSLPVSSLLTSPNGTIFALTFGLTSAGQIYRSSDGLAWTYIMEASNLAINSLGELFAISTPYTLNRSTDNGDTWEALSLATYGEPSAICVSPTNEIYVGTFDGQCPQPGPHPCVPAAGLFTSDDRGESWTVAWERLNVYNTFATAAGDIFVIGEERSLLRFRPGDSSSANLDLTGVNAVVQLPEILYAGENGRGVFTSTDDGDTWEDANEGLINSSVVAMAAIDPEYILAGVSPNIWRTSDRGESWEEVYYTYGFEPLFIETGGAALYASVSIVGIVESVDQGLTWINKQFSAGGVDLNSRDVYSLLIMSDGRMYAGARQWDDYGFVDEGLFLSRDTADSWEKVGLDGLLVAAVAADSTGVILAGTTGAGVFRSTDDGETWGLSGIVGPPVTSILVTMENNVLVGTDGDGMYRSTDGGLNWNLVHGLTSSSISSMKMNEEGEILAGSLDGEVFLSIDGGVSWTQSGSGLTNMNVKSIAIDHDGYAFAGTEGSGVFRSIMPTTAVREAEIEIPQTFSLSQNYPNPFNPTTTFQFSIRSSVFANLSVYDLLGRRVATLVNKKLAPGVYTRQWDATGFASGVYFYKLQSGDFVQTRKLILLR